MEKSFHANIDAVYNGLF